MEENNKEVEEFLVEDLNQPQKGIPPELEKMIKTKIRQMSNGVFSEEEQEDIYNNLSKEGILASQKNGTLDTFLNEEIKKLIIEKLRKKNEEEKVFVYDNTEQPKEEKEEEIKEKEQNEEKTEEEIEENLEKEDNEKDSDDEVVLETEKEEEIEKIPADVKKACERIGVNKIRGYFYVNANDLSNKVDNTMVNKYGNRVLILEVPTEKIEGPNKYYGFQNNKMVVYGNEDQAVKDVTGNVTKMGKVVEPLKLQEPKAVNFDNKDGMVVNEQLDDNKDMSVQEANNYRDEMEKLLEEYSNKVEALKEDDDMDLNEKIDKMRQNDGEFFTRADEIAKKYDISINDRENINEKVLENSVETAKDEVEEYKEELKDNDEPDYFEVPGKRTR